MTKVEKVAKVLALAIGDEVTIDGRVWFRIDSHEYKVHREGTEPDAHDSDTTWVPRKTRDIREMV